MSLPTTDARHAHIEAFTAYQNARDAYRAREITAEAFCKMRVDYDIAGAKYDAAMDIAEQQLQADD